MLYKVDRCPPCKLCGLDPLLPWLRSSDLVARITSIIISSLESSVVPDAFKQAVITSVLKSDAR